MTIDTVLFLGLTVGEIEAIVIIYLLSIVGTWSIVAHNAHNPKAKSQYDIDTQEFVNLIKILAFVPAINTIITLVVFVVNFLIPNKDRL